MPKTRVCQSEGCTCKSTQNQLVGVWAHRSPRKIEEASAKKKKRCTSFEAYVVVLGSPCCRKGTPFFCCLWFLRLTRRALYPPPPKALFSSKNWKCSPLTKADGLGIKTSFTTLSSKSLLIDSTISTPPLLPKSSDFLLTNGSWLLVDMRKDAAKTQICSLCYFRPRIIFLFGLRRTRLKLRNRGGLR